MNTDCVGSNLIGYATVTMPLSGFGNSIEGPLPRGGHINREAHWNRVYETKRPDTVSWYQQHPSRSLAYIRREYVALSERVIDVGAGVPSSLIDQVVSRAPGYVNPVARDVSARAIHRVQFRLGDVVMGGLGGTLFFFFFFFAGLAQHPSSGPMTSPCKLIRESC